MRLAMFGEDDSEEDSPEVSVQSPGQAGPSLKAKAKAKASLGSLGLLQPAVKSAARPAKYASNIGVKVIHAKAVSSILIFAI